MTRVPEPIRGVTLAPTCIVDVLAPSVATAAVRLLRVCGLDVAYSPEQTCCGQPAWNAGFAEEAARVARQSLDALCREEADAVVVLAGSCATMQRVFWRELFELVEDHDAAVRADELARRTFEFAEFLRTRPLPPLRAASGDRVGYHHSCHMLRELRIEKEPTELLDAVAQSRRVEWEEATRCCGFGGLFSTKLPETSVAMADEKLQSAERAGADCIVGCDTSCLLHLRTRAEHLGSPLRFQHLAEYLLDALDDHREPS